MTFICLSRLNANFGLRATELLAERHSVSVDHQCMYLKPGNNSVQWTARGNYSEQSKSGAANVLVKHCREQELAIICMHAGKNILAIV